MDLLLGKLKYQSEEMDRCKRAMYGKYDSHEYADHALLDVIKLLSAGLDDEYQTIINKIIVDFAETDKWYA